ncbi:MAG: oligosaccharide flippase family protein [Cyclobacteriaceae bacterium]|nr:oligosaccharide flippase family protein [Cyclobacteriaceae bacterium]
MITDNNKRIAKNTLMLYLRMFLTMAVSLFTVRIVLKTLGAVDYGLYNVVGGVVAMLTILSSSMAPASQRFFSFELGKENNIQLKRTFSLTLSIYFIFGVILLILAETVGLWFLKTKMEIPADREFASFWVYQFSIASFLVTIIAIPYNAAIIAHENLKVFAYISILEVILKLAVVYLLLVFNYDKLIVYSILLFFTTLIINSIYRIYCVRKYSECKYEFYWDKDLFKSLLGFSGWTLFGVFARMLNNQGINILLNIFFGPVVNATRAIASRVSSVVNQFVTNFLKAVQPQITKNYAGGEKVKMMKLVFQSTRFSFYMLLLVTIPILFEANFILTIWLDDLPDYVVIFTRLIILTSFIDLLTYPLNDVSAATGNIKIYQTVAGSIMILNLPISYLVLNMGYPPQSTMYVLIIILSVGFSSGY